MAYGYSSNAPAYGYQRSGMNLSGTASNPYYKAAQMLRNQAGLFGNGLIQGESKADTPFTNLASTGATTVAPRPPAYTQAQVAASLAANPHASKGGYEGSTPMADIPNLGGDQTGPPSLYDYRTDPILQEINALSTGTRQNADTGALALKKQIAVKYGDRQLGDQIGDPLTAQAAEQNPNSVFAQLKQMYDTGAHNFDEGENQANLFYSGHRIKGQQDLANQYQGQLAGVAGNEQDALGQIDANRLAAILGADTNDVNAQQNAADKAIQIALAGGYSFGGYDASGNPIFNKPADKTPSSAAPPPADSAPTATTDQQAGAAPSLNGPLAVGQTNIPRIYQLLGRKTDPRYNQ